MDKQILSWGRAHKFKHTIRSASTYGEISLDNLVKASPNKTILAHGMGRSYGDSNLNDQGLLLRMPLKDRVLSFDKERGVLRAEAGLTLDNILQFIVPCGWFLPVTPGTKFVTLGGAVANDVHGKNHHKSGSFGAFVRKFALKRSTENELIVCSSNKNQKMFEMTIGGLGLTGVLMWVELQLKPIKSAYLDIENIPYETLGDFFNLSNESDNWDYTVAWVDCFAPKSKCGRGIFTRAKFIDQGALDVHSNNTKLSWPFPTPAFFLNKISIKIFNALYRIRPGARYHGRVHYDPFFYPLDGIAGWNLLYGKRGFYQHQSLIPLKHAKEGVTALLEEIRKSGQGSFLAVIKMHGNETSPGVMSFCQLGQGVSLALDFPNKGKKTLELFARLDEKLQIYQGRLYPAKDGHMTSEFYKQSYPGWKALEAMRDPAFLSSFWRRVSKR